MTNPEIKLIKKWLDNPESVSTKERKDAVTYARDAANAVTYDDVRNDLAALGAYTVYVAAIYACTGNVARAEQWVKKYEDLTEQ